MQQNNNIIYDAQYNEFNELYFSNQGWKYSYSYRHFFSLQTVSSINIVSFISICKSTPLNHIYCGVWNPIWVEFELYDESEWVFYFFHFLRAEHRNSI